MRGGSAGVGGAEAGPYLEANHFIISATYRYSKGTEHYKHHERQLERNHSRLNNFVVNEQHNADLRVAWGISEYVSFQVSIPYINGSWAIKRPNRDGSPRFKLDSHGFGDISAIVKCWIWEPQTHPDWNFQIGVGVEAPTGDEDQRDSFVDNNGKNRRSRPVDRSIQPGDGGWGIILDLFGFYDVKPFEEWCEMRLFLAATYLSQPREKNRTYSAGAFDNKDFADRETKHNSVPDSFLAQIGIVSSIPGFKGFNVSVAGRLEGVPSRDVIGGSAGGRRPGYVISIEPGVAYTYEIVTVSLSVPIGIYKTRTDNWRGDSGDTTYSDYAIIAGISFKF